MLKTLVIAGALALALTSCASFHRIESHDMSAKTARTIAGSLPR